MAVDYLLRPCSLLLDQSTIMVSSCPQGKKLEVCVCMCVEKGRVKGKGGRMILVLFLGGGRNEEVESTIIFNSV